MSQEDMAVAEVVGELQGHCEVVGDKQITLNNVTEKPMCSKKLQDSQKIKIFWGHLAQHNNAMLWM